MKGFIEKIPKAELHLHIEGTFEPELMFEIAQRNKVRIPYKSIDKLKAAYDFNNLQEFLNIYYTGCNALFKEQDFYDMTMAYLKKAHQQNILHTEIMFDPQTHTRRRIPFKTVITGIQRARKDAKKDFGISTKLIMCFLRHLDEEAAFKTLEEAQPFYNQIDAVGLDSSEIGHPPSNFERVFKKARAEGYLLVAHAGEEGPAEYVWEALNLIKVDRIDHGNHSLEDNRLVQELVTKKMPLTVCPLSNLKLKVVKDISDHPLKKMMQKGLFVTVNSDDPAYFGGYVNENYLAIQQALELTREDIIQLAKNSFEASFLNNTDKKKCISQVEEFVNSYSD